MRKIALTMVLCVALLMATAAYAEGGEAHSKGAVTLNLDGMVVSQGGDSPTVAAGLGLGYFFADQWEIAVDAIGVFSPGEGESDSSHMIYVLGKLKYYFVNSSKVVPYVGIQAGGIFADSDNVGLYGGLVGLEFLVSDNATVYIEYNLIGLASDIDNGGDSDNLLHLGLIGLRYYF